MAIMEVWYGDPLEPIQELIDHNSAAARGVRATGPLKGDELCDGHRMHYLWDGTKWV